MANLSRDAKLTWNDDDWNFEDGVVHQRLVGERGRWQHLVNAVGCRIKNKTDFCIVSANIRLCDLDSKTHNDNHGMEYMGYVI